jgi:hypothetical protein
MWNVSGVVSFESMFSSTADFDQDLSSWNVGSAESLRSMFAGAVKLDQDLCKWGTLLNKSAAVTEMFLETGCAFGSDVERFEAPNLTSTPPGPFCYEC